MILKERLGKKGPHRGDKLHNIMINALFACFLEVTCMLHQTHEMNKKGSQQTSIETSKEREQKLQIKQTCNQRKHVNKQKHKESMQLWTLDFVPQPPFSIALRRAIIVCCTLDS